MRRLLLLALLVVACSKEDSPKEERDAGFVGREGDTDPDPTPVDPGPVDPGPTPDASTGDADSGVRRGWELRLDWPQLID